MSKIVLIGAGSAQFGLGTIGEIFQSEALIGSEVILLDINKTALNATLQKGRDFIEKHNLTFTLDATTDRKAALKDADFVIISIEVGDRFALWEQDWSVPQQYGIRQVYGENGGPGGLFHSLRIIPPILKICEDIQQLCPDAFVFNYSNPMSRICTTVHRRFPDLQFVGLCHEIASLERFLPRMLNVSYEDLSIVAGGLNHFSCLLKAKYRSTGDDAYPDILKHAGEFFRTAPGSCDYLAYAVEQGEIVDTEGSRSMHEEVLTSARDWTERTLFKFVLENFDLLPITTDSHFGEYLQWGYDVSDHRGILDFYRYYKEFLMAAKPQIELKLKERIVPIMEGILHDARYEEAAVNIPNRKLIAELPESLAVEVPAVISRSGVEGISLPKLPRSYAGLLQNQIAVHQMTAEAVLTRSKKAVVQALLVDPVVDKAAGLSQLVDVMISLQPEYLGYLE